MHYRSTRGKSSGLTFEQAVLQGLAPDGGLYIPETIPRHSLKEILSWHSLPFYEVAWNIFRPFIGKEEVPDEDLRDILKRSFSTFSNDKVTPVIKLDDLSNGQNPGWNNFYLLELFHGPTFAFKDVALQVLGNLFEYFLTRKNKALQQRKAAQVQAQGQASHPVQNGDSEDEYSITVLGATSGDTGGAAIYGLRGKQFVKVFILHPKGRISPVQEAQMTSVLDSNVYNVAVEGNFDDCQDVVKALFARPEFREKHRLAAINSINWARILAQTSYYFAASYQLWHTLKVDVDGLQKLSDDEILAKLPQTTFCVPTGNFGDILAGYYAVRMGLPNVHKLVIATNENDILHRFLETGTYNKRMIEVPVDNDASSTKSVVEPARATLSPAMDILVSSNFERLVWYLEAGDDRGPSKGYDAKTVQNSSDAVQGYMNQLNTTGGFSIAKDKLERCRDLFASQCVDDKDTLDAIGRYYKGSSKYILDPHTAVGVVAAERLAEQDKVMNSNPTCILSTAHPGKFPDAVLDAIENKLKYEDFAPKEMVEFLKMPKKCVQVMTDGGQRDVAIEQVALVIEDVEAGKPVFDTIYNQPK